jgi:hypothetical protein
MSPNCREGSLGRVDDDLMGLEVGEDATGRQRLTIIQQCQDGGMPDSSEPQANAMDLEAETKSEDMTQKFTQAIAPRPHPHLG